MLCDDLATSASRRTLSRFELGNPDNAICWDRKDKDGFYSVIDSHNHFRYEHLNFGCYDIEEKKPVANFFSSHNYVTGFKVSVHIIARHH